MSIEQQLTGSGGSFGNQGIRGQWAVLATAFLWSTSGLFIRLIDWHPMVIAGTRSAIAALFLLVIRLIAPPPKGVTNPPFPFWAAAVANALTMITFVVANKLTASANVILLQYGVPVWAALLGWALIREKPHWEHWGAFVMVIAGLFIFLKDGLGSGLSPGLDPGLDPRSLVGDGLSVVSGMVFASYSVFMRMMKDGNPRDAVLMSHVLTAVIGLPFVFLYPPALSASSVLPILYMGVMQIGLASVFFAYGIKRISAVRAMLTATLEPICNPLWVFLVIGEKPSASAFAGGGIIVAAVVISSVIGMRRESAAISEHKAGTKQEQQGNL